MSIVITDLGSMQIGNSYFKKTNPSGGNSWSLRLFANDHVVTDEDTLTAFTEASGGGYAAKTLIPDDAVVSIVGGVAQAAFPPQSFVFSGPLTTNPKIYGVYIVDADNVVIGAETLELEYTPQTSGDIFEVIPVIQLSKGIPS